MSIMRILFFSVQLITLSLIISCSALTPRNLELWGQGNYAELAKHEETVIAQSSPNIDDYYYLTEAYLNLKQYDKLFFSIKRFEEYAVKSKVVYADPYRWRATAYLELGDYVKAIEEARKAVSILPNIFTEGPVGVGQRTAKMKSLTVLCVAYSLINDRKNAEASLKLLERIELPALYGWARVRFEKINCLAMSYMALGKYDKAIECFNDSVLYSVTETILKPVTNLVFSGKSPTSDEVYDSYLQMPKSFMLSRALLETGQDSKAKSGYDNLLAKRQIDSNGEIYWMLLFDRGRIAEKEGALEEAVDFYKRSVDIIEQQRSSINTEASKIGFVGNKEEVYYKLIRALYLTNQYDRAFEYVERAKARALVDLLATKKDFAVKEGNEQDVRSIMAKNDEIQVEAINQDTAIDKSNTRGVSIKVKGELINKAPELASLVTVTSKPVTELQNILPQNEILLEYYYRDKDLYAFILSAKTLTAIKLNGDNLAEDVVAFRKAIEMLNSAHFLDISLKLYQRLFQPIEHAIDKRRLTIVPHGVLHYLPINALHDGKNYLIDRYSIRMMPSANALRYLTGKKTANKAGILAFGNPDLGDPKYDLAYAQKEAIEVIKTFPNSKVFLRKEASEEALRKYGSSYNYIHFATHGQFYAETPLKSALRLSPDSQYNGVISADKLYSMQLDADLVTLSACDTGLSKIANGDDLVGLTRGFLYAGSSSIVASLWKVDDLATSQLMMRFYKEMQSTDKREALRTAALETKGKYPHPYFWASFQLTGMSE